MDRKRSLPRSCSRLLPITAVLFPCLQIAAADSPTQTSFYRCVAPDGKIEFRQTSCASDSSQKKVTVEDHKVGWEGPKLKFEHKSRGLTDPPKSKRKKDKKERTGSPTEEQCWKKHQSIEEIDRKLRRGYKPSTGDDLRHKRRVYKDYVRRFCK